VRRRSEGIGRLGFSLLEVMFAVALFGAVVTFILSAQGGLVASNKRAATMSQAVEIARCRMSELEEKQLKLGYPEIEEKDTSTICCDDQEAEGFTCDWQVERVKLPEQTALGGDAGLSSLLGGGLGLDAGIGSVANGLPTSLPSNIGNILLNPAGGAGLNLDAGIEGVGQSLQQSFGGAGAQGLLSMVFSIVYPSLKPLLEAAIRRITVTVRWKEGSLDRDFTLTQYVTNPSRAGLLGSMAEAGAFDSGLAPNLPGTTPTAAPGAPGGLFPAPTGGH
jgi:general secretion pathway protein I